MNDEAWNAHPSAIVVHLCNISIFQGVFGVCLLLRLSSVDVGTQNKAIILLTRKGFKSVRAIFYLPYSIFFSTIGFGDTVVVN